MERLLDEGRGEGGAVENHNNGHISKKNAHNDRIIAIVSIGQLFKWVWF